MALPDNLMALFLFLKFYFKSVYCVSTIYHYLIVHVVAFVLFIYVKHFPYSVLNQFIQDAIILLIIKDN